MKRVITVALILILFTILDNSLMPFLTIKHIYPSLVFIFVVFYSIINGNVSAIYVGVFSGLLQDVYLMNGIGINMFINMVICLLAAQIGKTIFKDKLVIPIITCFGLSILKGVLMFIILYLVGQRSYFNTVLYVSLYNMIISILIYKKVYILCQKDFMVKKWRF
ncbi:rod shape-determining protein MreD [Clostridium novyi A str. 4552]|uniref:Rod shape-determining protein MreD n=1 Tax=Clostridium novyi A str. 4552 TaxID=1444289 RepID=A0A0A0I6B9_CLONO|nr:rod shape-determining protein MreD [Clostridium novyi]KGM96392.1 rod shape-determining protein MreD [Clostridium novyi A str. 4552]